MKTKINIDIQVNAKKEKMEMERYRDLLREMIKKPKMAQKAALLISDLINDQKSMKSIKTK